MRSTFKPLTEANAVSYASWVAGSDSRALLLGMLLLRLAARQMLARKL
jgi:hypothetical protein